MNSPQPLTEHNRQINRSATNTKSRIFVFISLKSCIKAVVINAFCHGLVPAKVTEWIIQKGGLTHD